MPTALQLPYVRDPASRTGRALFRKQILPLSTVKHPDHGDLTFTRDRLDKIRTRFMAGAMDCVPFVLVDSENRHTDDPERARGEVKGLELAADGLYAMIEASEKGADLLANTPNLPVSVRLKTLADGSEVLAHVAGTHDPVARGMKAWEPVDASRDGEVMDFSDRGTFTLPGVTDTKKAEGKDDTAADALSKEEVGKFRSFLQGLTGSGGDKPADKPDVKADAETLTDADVAALLAGTDTRDTEKVPATASLSEEDRSKLDMSHTGVLDLTARLGVSEMTSKLDGYITAGVPPALVNAARTSLIGDGTKDLTAEQKSIVIDFANGNGNPASAALFAALDAAKGTIDFSEKGTTTTVDMSDAERKAEQEECDKAAEGYR